MRPEILYAVFCEQIRDEAGGKVSLLGVWGNRCIVQSRFPVQFPNFGVHVFISDPDQTCNEVRVSLQFPGGAGGLERDVQINMDPDKSSHNLNLNLVGLPITQPGPVVLTLRLPGQEPREFRLDIVDGAA